MFEVYTLVEKKKPVVLKYVGLFLLGLGVFSILALVLGLFIFLPTALIGTLLGYFIHTRNYEYEYSYFDGDLRFAKIINKSRRKRLPGYKMEDVMQIAPAGDYCVQKYENDNSVRVTRYTTGQKGAKVYVLVVKQSEGTELVYFEPDERYLDAICMKYGYKVKK